MIFHSHYSHSNYIMLTLVAIMSMTDIDIRCLTEYEGLMDLLISFEISSGWYPVGIMAIKVMRNIKTMICDITLNFDALYQLVWMTTSQMRQLAILMMVQLENFIKDLSLRHLKLRVSCYWIVAHVILLHTRLVQID